MIFKLIKKDFWGQLNVIEMAAILVHRVDNYQNSAYMRKRVENYFCDRIQLIHPSI